MDEYLNKAKPYLLESDDSKNAEIKVRKLLTDEFKDRNTVIRIKEFLIHKYDCKCVYSITIYISQRKNLDIVGSKKTYYDMYTDIRSQLIDRIRR